MESRSEPVKSGKATVRIALGAVPVLAALVLVLAFAGTASADPCAGGARTGRYSLKTTSGGIARYALVNVPPGAPAGKPLPLVLALHGAGGNGRDMEQYTGLSGYADRYGFVAVYPSSVPKFWNITASPNKPDDVAFMNQLLDTIESQVCIDQDRVYATGVSNGGGMVALLACAMSDRLAAVAPVAGNYLPLPSCHPDRPVSMLEIHGTADRSVPYRIVPGFMGQWLAFDGCPSNMNVTKPARGVMRYVSGTCSDGARVSHLQIFGGPHDWPGNAFNPHAAGGGGHVSADVEVWRFFAGLRRASAAAKAGPSG
jgi:polyhydroxybutyrate depolymerase